MVKHFEPIWVLPEDKRLLKSAASLKGMKMHEYFAERIRADAQNAKDQLDAVARSHEEKRRGVRSFGLFR